MLLESTLGWHLSDSYGSSARNDLSQRQVCPGRTRLAKHAGQVGVSDVKFRETFP